MQDNKKIYWIWISTTFGAGSTRINSLAERFNSDSEEIFNNIDSLPAELLPTSEKIKSRIKERNADEAKRIYSYCVENNIDVITPSDPIYPVRLKTIPAMPAVLYSQGNFPHFDSRFAVAAVGSRNTSPYGEKNGYNISFDLAKSGSIIVSGMARGIDTVCHKGAIAAEGETVAVTGCGIDVCYPPENIELRESICEHGCVITEFSPGTSPMPANFPKRNRIISGLSNATLVVEAAYKSGALITADLAVKQGRAVFALPGNIDSENSVGTNDLIRSGARIIQSASDIYYYFETEGYGIDKEKLKKEPKTISPLESALPGRIPKKYTKPESGKKAGRTEVKKQIDRSDLSDNELAVLDIIENAPSAPDVICEKTGYSISEVMTALTMLEIKGVIHPEAGGIFALS